MYSNSPNLHLNNPKVPSPFANSVIPKYPTVLVPPPKNPPTPLPNRIRDTKPIEQPLVPMASVRVRLKTILLLAPPIHVPSAALGNPRHTELAGTDLDVLALERGAGVRVQAREAG